MFVLKIILSFIPFVLIAVLCNILKNNEEFKKIEKRLMLHVVITMVISFTGYFFIAGVEKDAFFHNSSSALPMVTIAVNIINAASFTVFCLKLRKGKRTEGAFENLWSIFYTKRKKEKSEYGSYLKKAGILAPPIIGILYMLLIFGVYETYFANLNEWRFGFSHISNISLSIFLVASVALILIFPLILNKNAAGKLSMLLSAAFVLLYIQNAFLNVDKLVNGSMEDISGIQLMINTYFWCIILFVPFLLYKRFGSVVLKISTALSGFLLVIQLAPLPYLMSDYEEPPKVTTANRLSGDDQYVLSQNGNVIVFIMDSFHSGFFDEFVEKNPQYRDTLKDFTYYNNIATKSYYTTISLPSMFTCGELKFDRSLIDANREMWEADNAGYFYGTMHQNGYDTNLYIDCDEYYGYADNMIGMIDNIKEVECETETDDLKTYLAMLKLNCYKYFPFAFKDIFYVPDSMDINTYSKMRFLSSTGERYDEAFLETWNTAANLGEALGIHTYNYTYYNDLISKGLTTVDGNKKLVFQYLLGVHSPYRDFDGKTHLTMEEAIEQCMKIFTEYIDMLKEKGIYDNSCIILTADHGDTIERESDVVMLIKKPGQTGDTLSVNSAPGLLQSDMLPTILDCIGLDYSPLTGGTSFASLPEDTQRERLFWVFLQDYSYPNAHKCASKGSAVANRYREFRYTGSSKDLDISTKKDLYYEGSIYDYWW